MLPAPFLKSRVVAPTLARRAAARQLEKGDRHVGAEPVAKSAEIKQSD
jgi:hypothetical protein